MTATSLHDRATIETVLRQNVYLHIYSIGDLDDFFWPYTTWYSLQNGSRIDAIVLLYFRQPLPTLIALSDNPEEIRHLLESVKHLLPPRFYAHFSPGVELVLNDTHHMDSHGEHLKMALLDESRLGVFDCPDTVKLARENKKEIVELYSMHYPGNWFDPRMLETEQYYGIRCDGLLVSVAGVHVYSPEYRVAALGNVTTAEGHRCKGLATRVTARACLSLLETVDHIGLNVKADNPAAVTCYQKLGFEAVATYGEFLVQIK